ncbi:MAG: threonine dehydratase [Gaiellaceae bacterium]|nr:threonine dehydratase [Gaiellaceae bacterium]MDX6479454.1 threonine dehydratase [Gaiellaceae bacterium]MDX6510352.1 threonine dehydratase [Gaiellaceae bacterium]
MATRTAPTLADIEQARARLEGIARVTPVFGSESFSRRAGREVLLKAENLQRTGAFKVRGAVNKIATLSDAERAAGVVAASAGNHGQAVAWAAREQGVGATVFMPQDSPMAKVDATRNYGATVELGGTVFEEAVVAAEEYVERSGATFVHPFEDEVVIAGQGTIGLELSEQVPDADTFVIPIGGGGLAAGIAIALKAKRPEVRIVGVQAKACGPLAGGTEFGFTIAEGIAVKQPGELTTSILREHVDEIVAVTDEEISEAIVLLLERSKLLVEGAGAASVAAVLGGHVSGKGPVCALLSGGNIDPTLLISVMRHGLTLAGRFLVVRTRVPDRPGELVRLLELVARERGNLVSVEHHREGMAVSIAETEVELTLGTRDEEHCTALLAALRDQGYEVERLR